MPNSSTLPAPFLEGQRVRNDIEPTLGLGIVRSMPNARMVEVVFHAAQEVRRYNISNAPLRRVRLEPGQLLQTRDGQSLRVERVTEHEGLLIYHADGKTIPEQELADAGSASSPLEYLQEDQLSHFSAFGLRERAWNMRAEVSQTKARGLMGARVTLLPHQLAIAHRVASQEYPRVLLADEVGLGKTIEACLIYSALRSAGRADRVLILTPSSLVNQWLTEIYRRFNELFRVANTDGLTWDDLEVNPAEEANVFKASPRLIASVDWICQPKRLAQALKHHWDLVIVDEAHHLEWSSEKHSPQYDAVEALSHVSHGLLLLTATPLRQGPETQFALLRLVDPERFSDYQEFIVQQSHIKEVAGVAAKLAEGKTVAAKEIKKLFPDDLSLLEHLNDPPELLRQLVDRHGTGRILIRNRRERLGGFPGRQLYEYPLPKHEEWDRTLAWPELVELAKLTGDKPPITPPSPKFDPRWKWTLAFVRELASAGDGKSKVVVMAALPKVVLNLEKFFKSESGIKVAIFHEGLSLLERDRQAAYFADPEGAQVLLSSEIGGEGRNFQFCHHLVLFDMPIHPDALEQRIGRLDRIGQTETIQVHVPYVVGTPSDALLRWYEALGAFREPQSGGEFLLEKLAPTLYQAFSDYPHAAPEEREGLLKKLIAKSIKEMASYRDAVQQSVDYLIDLNSFQQELGNQLVAEVKNRDLAKLKTLTNDLFEYFGVQEDDLADPLLAKVSPGHMMKIDPFPGLRTEGYLVTYDRECALAREDVQFLSEDHPLVDGAMALLLDQPEGRASIALWPGAPQQSLWVEFLFVMEAIGPKKLELARFFPSLPVRVTVDMRGQLVDLDNSKNLYGSQLHTLGHQLWARLASVVRDRLSGMLETAQASAKAKLQVEQQSRVAQATSLLASEQERLEHLHELGSVAPREVQSHHKKTKAILKALENSCLTLDAVRVVVLDPRA